MLSIWQPTDETVRRQLQRNLRRMHGSLRCGFPIRVEPLKRFAYHTLKHANFYARKLPVFMSPASFG